MKKILMLIFLVNISIYSQSKNDKILFETKGSFDFFQNAIILQPRSFDDIKKLENNDKKSGLLAGILSAIVPGAGEFYAESYIQSGVLFALEVTSWVMNAKYNKKGDNQTIFFQNYADDHWSVERYANWIQKNLSAFVPDKQYYDQCVSLLNQLYKSGNKPWEKINWDNLNEIENIIGAHGVTNNGFSHKLPGYGEQQYYELIGKYPQFRQGWDEADPNETRPYIPKDSLSTQFKWYSSERGIANDFYKTATTYASIIMMNHLISALDAVLCAYLYNKAHISITYDSRFLPDGRLSVDPYLNLSIRF